MAGFQWFWISRVWPEHELCQYVYLQNSHCKWAKKEIKCLNCLVTGDIWNSWHQISSERIRITITTLSSFIVRWIIWRDLIRISWALSRPTRALPRSHASVWCGLKQIGFLISVKSNTVVKSHVTNQCEKHNRVAHFWQKNLWIIANNLSEGHSHSKALSCQVWTGPQLDSASPWEPQNTTC